MLTIDVFRAEAVFRSKQMREPRGHQHISVVTVGQEASEIVCIRVISSHPVTVNVVEDQEPFIVAFSDNQDKNCLVMSSTLLSLEGSGDSLAVVKAMSRLTKMPKARDAASANDCYNEALEEPWSQKMESKRDLFCRTNSTPWQRESVTF